MNIIMKKELVIDLHNYIREGIIWGTELLFLPDKAIEFITILASHRERILGCELWRFLEDDKSSKKIVALLGAGLLIESPRSGTIEENALITREFIANRLPEDAELVSLLYENGDIYDIIKNTNNSTM